MKTKATIAAVVGIALWAASPAMAQPGAGAGTTTGGGNVCLWTYMIDHTHVVNPRTVLFYTRDGHVWRNDLKSPCPGLDFHGFSFVSRSDQICSNAVGITAAPATLGRFFGSRSNAPTISKPSFAKPPYRISAAPR